MTGRLFSCMRELMAGWGNHEGIRKVRQISEEKEEEKERASIKARHGRSVKRLRDGSQPWTVSRTVVDGWRRSIGDNESGYDSIHVLLKSYKTVV